MAGPRLLKYNIMEVDIYKSLWRGDPPARGVVDSRPPLLWRQSAECFPLGGAAALVGSICGGAEACFAK